MRTNINMTEYSVAEVRYSENFMDRGYAYDKKAKWNTVNGTYEKFMKKIGGEVDIKMSLIDNSDDSAAILYDIDGAQVILNVAKKVVSLNIASFDSKVADDHIKALKKAFPLQLEKPDQVKVRFWYNTNQGPANISRNIVVPDWKKIQGNYEPQTLDSLEYLMKEFKPSGGGQLIIFHGPPGTGKSYSLRALLDSWRSWCVADYVLDPENLFSGPQSYMASLVLRGASDSYEYDEDEGVAVQKDSDKWKLLILEDSGELLSADAKYRTGQGLSRLLNLVDGLIGQGLRVLVLITTNEDIEKLHPAVSREGRCAAAVKYRPFSYDQAIKWLTKHSDDPAAMPDISNKNKGVTLADLYSQIRRDDNNPRKKMIEMDLKQIGFKMR